MKLQIADNFDQKLAELYSSKVTVNLDEQTITNEATGEKESFDINPYKKNCLLQGYDDIDFLLSKKNDIEAWEENNK